MSLEVHSLLYVHDNAKTTPSITVKADHILHGGVATCYKVLCLRYMFIVYVNDDSMKGLMLSLA